MINTRAPDGANKASNCIHQYFLLYKMEISMALVISDMIVCGWSFGQREIQRSSNWSHFPLLVKLSRDGGKLIPTSARISPSYSLNSTLCPVALTAPTMFFGNSLFLPWQEYHCLRCVRHLWLLSRFSLLDSDWGTRRIRKCERPTCSTNQPTIYIHVIHKIQCILYMTICSVWERTYFPM